MPYGLPGSSVGKGAILSNHEDICTTPGCPVCGCIRLSERMYATAKPLRDFVQEHPEFKDTVIKVLGEALTRSFAGDFYAGKKP